MLPNNINFFQATEEEIHNWLAETSLTEIEETYDIACDAYYDESKTSIMPDMIFDIIEESLRSAGSDIVDNVNGPVNTKDLIHEHPTPMLSLEKNQVKDTPEILLPLFALWQSKVGNDVDTEYSPKFDGNAINLLYLNGNIKQAITRGKHGKGRDVTNKLTLLVPKTIPFKQGLVEVRGEVVIPLATFEKEYYDEDDPNCPANPRNFIGGVLSRDVVETEIIKDLAFVAYSIILEDINLIPLKDNNTIDVLTSWGFNKKYPIFKRNASGTKDLVSIYNEFLEYRKTCVFQLDGIVAKMPEQYRERIGSTGHHPKWARAIKFPAKDAITKIVGIVNTMGSTGKIYPKAMLAPVELDGTTVNKATLHNYRYVKEQKINIGAIVKIRKAGDIIPQIIEILETSDTEFEYPTHYKGHNVYWDGPHICVENYQDLPDFAVRKINKGLKILDVKGIGPATIENIHLAGIKTIHGYFDGTITKELLIASGKFKEGRALDKVFESINNLKKAELWRVINSVQIDGIGKTISTEFAKYLSGLEYSFAGFEKALMAEATKEGSEIKQKIVEMVNILKSRNVDVTIPKDKGPVNPDAVTFEMTGEAPEQFKSRGEFAKLIEPLGYIHGSLNKNTKLLITDDLTSNTSKMKNAVKFGAQIKTYEQVLADLNL